MPIRPSPARILAAHAVAIATAVLAACDTGGATLPDEGPLRPTRLTFSSQPENSLAGQPIGYVSVTVLDNLGDTVLSSSASIRLSIQVGTGNASAQLSGTTQVVAVNGTAAFPGVSIDSAGSGYRLLAASDAIGSALSDSFDVRPFAAASAAGSSERRRIAIVHRPS